ncbi:hypothetical protein D3C84_991660 [compost metagenome]
MNFENAVHDDRQLIAERVRPEHRTRMAAVLAEQFGHQIGEAVQYEVMLCEVGSGVHVALRFDDAFHIVEASDGLLDDSKHLDACGPGELVALLGRIIGAKLAPGAAGRTFARYE